MKDNSQFGKCAYIRYRGGVAGEEPIDDVCVCCGKPAKKLVYWGRQY